MKKILFGFLASLMLISCGGATAEATKVVSEKKNLALQLYSLRDDIKKDFDGTIKAVGDMGFVAIEAAGYDDGKFYGKTPAEFKAALDAVGLKAISSHTAKQLTEDQLKSKDFSEALTWWEQCFDAHKAAGMTYVVAPWMATPTKLVDLQTYCEYYNEVGKLGKSKGVLFGYHNHAHEFAKVEDKVMLDYMIENTNPEYVFFEMDVYWVVRGAASPVDYFHKYPNRFRLLHIKDNKELGQSGMVGFDAIFKSENTDKAGVEYLVVEVEQYNFAPKESVKISYDYLQGLEGVKVSYAK